MKRQSIDELLEATRDSDARVRKNAARELCPCEIKLNDSRTLNRLIEMTADPDRDVRRIALHTLIDGSPRSRQADVVRALESMYNDPDPKVRRHVRKILARHRTTGKINLNLH
jgi:HEAT repeat protein